jgi:hypothetical protein
MKRALDLLDQFGDVGQRKPGLRFPRSRAVILKACRSAGARRLASPRGKVWFTIS